MKKALILVDIQNDFVEGGALAVRGGQAVVPVANQLTKYFDLVVATQDWHPADHGSFASKHAGRRMGDIVDLGGLQQILWPDHCVQETWGAQFVDGLDIGRIDRVFHKGVDRKVDSYSGFFDNGQKFATGLGDYLKEQGVDEVALVGLATDYCVKYTALDARKLGLKTRLILEGVRGVEVHKGDIENAIEEMKMAGVEVVSIRDFGEEKLERAVALCWD